MGTTPIDVLTTDLKPIDIFRNDYQLNSTDELKGMLNGSEWPTWNEERLMAIREILDNRGVV